MEGSPNVQLHWKRSIESSTNGASKAGTTTQVAPVTIAGRRPAQIAEMYAIWVMTKTVCKLSGVALRTRLTPSRRVRCVCVTPFGRAVVPDV